jgi:NMD protein affecting ribosome stability and mRNA decay
MTKIFKTPHCVKLPKSQHEVEEFAAKKGLLICEKCNIFYYKKSWHHNADKFIAEREDKDLPLNFILCPTCQMVKNKQYEGRIVIKNIPEKLKEELVNLIKAYCRRAYLKDPLDKLIDVKKEGKDIIVTTTENELANKLGKKIKDTFNKVIVKTSFIKEPGDTALVKIEFLEK